MNHTPRLSALLLAAAMLLALLTGCGQKTENDSGAASNAVSVPEETAAAPTAQPENPAETESSQIAEPSAEEESIAFGTVTYPLETDGATLTYWLPWMPALSQCYSNYGEHPAYAAAEEYTGVPVEYISCAM